MTLGSLGEGRLHFSPAHNADPHSLAHGTTAAFLVLGRECYPRERTKLCHVFITFSFVAIGNTDFSMLDQSGYPLTDIQKLHCP